MTYPFHMNDNEPDSNMAQYTMKQPQSGTALFCETVHKSAKFPIQESMILGLHSLLFPTKVKAAAAIITSDQAHDFLIRFSLTNQVGGSSCLTALR